ncbi:hypothetical protein E0W68_08765 [Flavobacterium salilacus subsp. salilacus]|uniref:hypothetical protein n=1 Tax=Flavobacterium TaxID=237 RepID=UPI0010750F89|nr:MULTISPECIES: hypothetical protein [Flavobacterium]KAF2518410.1 hypothetical protein E0W68_08765 [Flavobacterium salilacus subsp. salilacus]MBE1615046.1 hypothetical protein [Flavobacterium sp. SaA2.13]NDI98037.1 hypothetical protein [Flavobacterium salilacus subsp. altitudinum]
MKVLVNIVLLLFISFLAVPTIVSLLDDSSDVSVSYSLNEEEIHKELQEIKAGPSEFTFCFLAAIKKSSKITSNNLRRHKCVFGDVFSPPPDVIII